MWSTGRGGHAGAGDNCLPVAGHSRRVFLIGAAGEKGLWSDGEQTARYAGCIRASLSPRLRPGFRDGIRGLSCRRLYM